MDAFDVAPRNRYTPFMFLFAAKTLMQDRGKFLIALLGVTFSLVLVNVQGGLFLGMFRKSSLLVDNCAADIWVAHPGIHSADLPGPIREAWVDRVRAVPGVAEAAPYVVGIGWLQLPNNDIEDAWVIGSDTRSHLGEPWSFAEGGPQDLHRPEAVSIDSMDDWKFDYLKVGGVMEINRRRATITCKTRGILGFVSAPYVFTSLENARNYIQMPADRCSFFLVKAEPGADLKELCKNIHSKVPQLAVYTAEEFGRKSRVYWATRTGLGLSFGGATALGLLVGLAMVAQSLYALVLDHLSDYATLKAMGAENSHICGVLLSQAMLIATLGSAIGVALVYLIQFLVSTPQVTIDIPVWLAATGVGLAVLICLLSSLLPFRRIRSVDPASVLQGY
jgi:putative ABC transport system permease protein